MKMINKPLKPMMQAALPIMLPGFLFLLLQLFSSMLSAQEKIDLLIINSDHTIKKYALTQEVFQANQDKAATVINLAAPSVVESEVVDLIKQNQFKVIYCIGTKAYLLASRVAPNKKIVFSSAINWRRLPVTEQSYGIAQELPAGMQLTMYRYLFPEIKKIGVLYSKQFNQEWLSGAIQAAQDVGIELVGKDVSAGQNLSTAIEELLAEVDALWLIADPLVLADRASVVEIFLQAENRNKPVFTYSEPFIDFGAILVISADIPTIGRQASAWVDDLRNDKTITERVTNPLGSHIILNMKKIKDYSIRLNKEALGSVNQIIE